LPFTACMQLIGGDYVDDKFVAIVIESENVCSNALPVVKRQDGDGGDVDFVQPLREICVQHCSAEHSIAGDSPQLAQSVFLKTNPSPSARMLPCSCAALS